MIVVNSFNKDFIEPIIKITGLYGIDNVTIDVIKYIKNLSTSDVIVFGFLKQTSFDKARFKVFIAPDFDGNFNRLMIHECAHICQYLDGQLSLDNNVECWEGKPIDFTSDYRSRPHEVDARRKVRRFNKKVRKANRKRICNRIKNLFKR